MIGSVNENRKFFRRKKLIFLFDNLGSMMSHHREKHRSQRIGWLRAAVLGANDGILSTASLVVGVASSHATHQDVLVAGVAGLVAGAMSMAAGEYVSVSSQADTERADVEREKEELATDDEGERKELAGIYVRRGLDADLAKKVADKLMEKDALGAHLRDELGMTDMSPIRPVQAAVASATTFAVGAVLPLLVAVFAPLTQSSFYVAGASLLSLALIGALSARAGGARLLTAVVRVTFWGALAMAITAGIGALFGTRV
jgi:VIT1/CCC1 family predicted Fe2+/Mn2+ transporter